MQLTTYKAVPSGMSFDLDISGKGTAYLLSTPGNEATVALQGAGVWAVEVLVSPDGVNFTQTAVQSLPGQWRYNTKGAAAAAIRVLSYTSGTVSGMLAHGGLTPITNVSPVFGSFLVFSYNATLTEPPTGNQIRFNGPLPFSAVTKVWIANTSVDGVDQYYAIRHIPVGGTLLVQNKTSHLDAVLFGVVGPIIDKGAYVEIPVAFQQEVGNLTAQQVLIAAFNPGPVLALSPTLTEKLTHGR
jgi:hypothetical protein